MKLSALKTKFKGQWILARVTKQDQFGQVLEAEPIAQAKSRQQIDKKLEECQERHITVVYTGPKKPTL